MDRRRHRPLPFAVLPCVVAVAAPNCFGQTVPAGADTWVSKRYPNRNYGADSGMRAASLGKQTLVRFAVPPLDGDVHRVVLRIYARAGAPRGLRVFSTSAAWDERAVNYKNAPHRGVLVGAVPGFSGRAWREIDVTSAVTAAGVEVIPPRGAPGPARRPLRLPRGRQGAETRDHNRQPASRPGAGRGYRDHDYELVGMFGPAFCLRAAPDQGRLDDCEPGQRQRHQPARLFR